LEVSDPTVSTIRDEAMFIKMLLMTIGGVCILVAVFMFAFPDVWDAAKDFDWSRMAEAIITHFGF
jgi:hypothetical protein